MDLRELLGLAFAGAALALVFIGIWTASYYSPAKAYERELRKERRKRRERKMFDQAGISKAAKAPHLQ